MIFVTVGEQLPFDRLISNVDAWALTSKKEVFAQIGNSSYVPQHISYKPFLSSEEFRDKVFASELIIAHAGIGTIITALEMGKPILIMPRQPELKEVRNDHQISTALRFSALQYADVAMDEIELLAKLQELTKLSCMKSAATNPPSPLLIHTIRNFIKQGN